MISGFWYTSNMAGGMLVDFICSILDIDGPLELIIYEIQDFLSKPEDLKVVRLSIDV